MFLGLDISTSIVGVTCINKSGDIIFCDHCDLRKSKGLFEKAKVLQDDIIIPYSLDNTENIIKNDSIIINTTPIGMQTNQTPLDLGLIHQNQILIDVIYTPLETSFIKYGNNIGAKTLNGLDMFIYQGLASLDLWFGESVSKQVNFTQLKSYLETNLC